ncbi:zf-HC2 domain-containing protein [Solwaraspora sp. WMMB335]|uniref:zf-HC2 domain-containing protein n=1 Tax=Solwaraspora sp. WMMB335 TaxID=3404118 RepID=UPI003B95FE49
MGCTDFRELLSAQLDGEAAADEIAVAHQHLAGCVDCRAWHAAAARLDALAASAGPEPAARLDESVLDALPTPRRFTAAAATLWLRGTLGVLGVVQFLLGATQIGGVSEGHLHVPDQVGGTAPNHLWHESAAWNVAIGAGFVWIALRRTRPSGILPTLTAFVTVLALLSVNDLIAGRVDYSRLLSHGFLVFGYVLLIALSRRGTDPDTPTGDRQRTGSRWRVELDEENPGSTPPPLRVITGGAASIRRRHDRAA